MIRRLNEEDDRERETKREEPNKLFLFIHRHSKNN